MDATLRPARLELRPRENVRPELQRRSSKRKSEEEEEDPGDAAKRTRRRGSDSYETTDEDEDTAEEDDEGPRGVQQETLKRQYSNNVPTRPVHLEVAASPPGGRWHTITTPQTAQPTPHSVLPGSRWCSAAKWLAIRAAVTNSQPGWSGSAGDRLSGGLRFRPGRRRGPAAPEEDALRRTEDASDDDNLVTQDLYELMTRACSMDKKDDCGGGGEPGAGHTSLVLT